MAQNLIIMSSPHFRSKTVTKDIMLDVMLALVPALIASIVLFGERAFTLSLFCVAACMVFEYLYRHWMKLSMTLFDFSAAVTGLLLAFNLPVTIPLWMAAIGCFVAIIIVKQLFGGLGRNFANPAIVGRIVLLVSFAGPMTSWIVPGTPLADAVTSATPLAAESAPGYLELFLGTVGGSMGETCKPALLIGGIYLVLRRVITATTPLVFMGTVALLSWALGADPLFHLLAGGLILGAIFMATDYVTTPTTELGKVVFGIGCGFFTVLIRLYAGYPEGVSFAILLMNILTPHIDRLCNTKPFGGCDLHVR